MYLKKENASEESLRRDRTESDMTIGEKIKKLREEQNISQEHLAKMLDVSWRLVAKWERSDAIPEIDKIVRLSEIFGVSTDVLINDDIELNSTEAPKKQKHTLSFSEVSEFIEAKSKAARFISASTFLIMLSVGIMLIIFNLPFLQKPLGTVLGISFFIISVAISVGIYIWSYYLTARYEYINKGDFTLAYTSLSYIDDTERKNAQTYAVRNIAATIICIISVIPLISTYIIANGNYLYVTIALAVTLSISGVGISMFIISGVERSAIASLKETRHSQISYSKRLEDSIESAFWTIVTAVYLLYSFKSGNWDKSWIIFVFAAAISGIISLVFSLVRKASGVEEEHDNKQ